MDRIDLNNESDSFYGEEKIMKYAITIILSFTGMIFGMQGVKLKPAPQVKQEYT